MTTDYYPLIRKAVDALDRPDEERRRELYERARNALVRQLQDMNRPDAEIDAHIEALGAACARIERDLASERKPQVAAPSVRLKGSHVRVDRAFDIPDNPAMPPRRRWKGIAIGAALAGLMLVGAGVYYFGMRDRDRPVLTSRGTAVRPPPTKTAAQPTSEVASETASYILRRQRVYYRTTHPPGTVILSVGQRFLYVVQPNQVAIRYAIAVGPQCQSLAGLFQVIEKVSGPDAGTTASTARFSPPALYFDSAHAVHDTKEPQNIGGPSPTGCFHSLHEDVVDLYDRVPLKERVVVAN